MKLIQSPNAWSCQLAAWAMALGVSLDVVVDGVGHDGSEIVWPDLPEPHCRRGFHPQEFYPLARILGCAVETVEAHPQLQNIRGDVLTLPGVDWEHCLTHCRGVLGGFTTTGTGHAVAISAGKVYDPRGRTFDVSRCAIRGFTPEILWIIMWLYA